MHTLVEAADQLEGSNPTKAGNAEERVVCPTCGEIFDELGYKVMLMPLQHISLHLQLWKERDNLI